MPSSLPSPSRGRTAWRYLAALAVLSAAVACQGDHLNPPALVDPAVLYWALELNHHAVTLSTTAPYDTMMLAATPRNQAGEVIAGLPAPEYHSTDPERVVVTPDGILVAAQLTSQPVAVVATLSTDNLTHADTMFVSVVNAPTPPVLGTLSIHPVPPDSAKHAMTTPGGVFTSFSYLLNHLVRATDTTGAALPTVSVAFSPVGSFLPTNVPIADLLVAFHSSDTTIALVQHRTTNGRLIYTVDGRRPGTVLITAEATAFGITKVDTIPFRIGLSLIDAAGVQVSDFGLPIPKIKNALIGVGGIVVWPGGPPADIVFADPASAAPAVSASTYLPQLLVCLLLARPSCTTGGNIPSNADQGIFQSRTFPQPGVYQFRTTAPGTSESLVGTVTVVDES